MSRIGKRPIEVPGGVDVTIDGRSVRVKGPRGELAMNVHHDMSLGLDDGRVTVERGNDEPRQRALHGLTRSLIANMVEGVTNGFSRTLEIVGVGYRADKKGDAITLNLGYSHQIHYDPPDGIALEVPNQTTVVVRGADKQVVGQVAAEIRGFRPPEPYKGKGVRYQGEQIRRKAGKTAGA